MTERRVLSAMDDNYILPFLTMAYSAKINSTKEFSFILGYDPKELSLKNRNLIFDTLKVIGISFICIEITLSTDMVRVDHISPTTYSKMIMADRLDGTVLYLDADLICLEGWDTIFLHEESSTKKYPISAVRDTGISTEMLMISKNESLKTMGLNYFNAGVLLIDCDEWKKRNYDKGWVGVLADADKLGFQWADQCVLNYLCKDSVKYLRNEYNVLASTRVHGPKRDSFILHFCGGTKPWFYSIFDLRYFLGVLFPHDVMLYLSYQHRLIKEVNAANKHLGSLLIQEQKRIRRKVHHPKFRSAIVRLYMNICRVK